MKKLIISSLVISLIISISGCEAVTPTSSGEEASSVTTTSGSTETSTTNSTDNPPITAKVKVEEITKGQIEDTISYVGTIRPASEINITARTEGIVNKVFFKGGDLVNKNDVIIDISDPEGKSLVQINKEIAKLSSENAKNMYDKTVARTKESVRMAEIGLETSRLNLSNTEEQLGITENQNDLIIKSSETQLQNSRNSLVRLQENTDLNKQQIGISDKNLIESTNISLENTYDSLELMTYSTLESIFVTLENNDDIPSGVNRLRNDLEDIQDDIDDVKRRDINDLFDVTEEIKEFILEVLDYINDDNFIEAAPTLHPTLRASLEGLSSQLNSILAGLTTTSNTLNALNTNTEYQLTSLDNQIKSIVDQIVLQENALNSAKVQSDLALHSLKSSINILKKNIESTEKSLAISKISAQTEIDQAKTQYENSLLQQEQVDIQTDYLKVSTNVSGRLSDVYVEEGQLLSPGTPVATIYQENQKEVEVYIDPKDLPKIPLKSKATITFREDDTEYIGEISEILPVADPNTHLVTATVSMISFPEIIVPNSIVNVEVSLNIEGDYTYIPLKSVLVREGGNYVFVIEQGKTKKKLVETGEMLGSKIEILSGLEVGDTLIIDGHRTLDEGVNVEIITD